MTKQLLAVITIALGALASAALLQPPRDFTLIVLPDTQYYSENAGHNPSPGGTGAIASIFQAQTQWIAEHRRARNIGFVSHVGDVVENGDNGGDPSEWLNANAALTLLDIHGIPYGIAAGNHDFSPTDDGGQADTFFNLFFGPHRWIGRAYYGGHYGFDNNNNYQLFSASGLDFIVIHIAYSTHPTPRVLDWADAVLKSYPDRRAIVTSHWILTIDGSFSAQGQEIYDRLKDNPNLFLLLCGHVPGEARRSDAHGGRIIHSILQNYQNAANGGDGFLRVYTFSPAANRVHVDSYSPRLGRPIDASDQVRGWAGAFEFIYDMQARR